MRLVSLVVILLYVILGSSLIFTETGNQFIRDPNRRWVGVIILIYGVYRAFRLYMRRSNTPEE